MKLRDKIVSANSIPINGELVEKIEMVYSCKLPEIVRHILSIETSVDYEDRNDLSKLSDSMMLEVSSELNSGFTEINLLPIFDKYDNDYVCYDYINDLWCMFNTVNDLVFNKQKNILDLL
jgi:hypothetical protein